MQIWIPAAATVLVAAGWSAAVADPPAERYDALVNSTARAAALEYGFEGTMHYAIAGERIALTLGGEVRVAWPNAGRVSFVYRPADAEGEDETTASELIGDGETVFQLDHQNKQALATADQWNFLLPQIAPLDAFLAREAIPAASVEEVADEARPGLVGLRCTFEEGGTQTLWLDESGVLRAVQVSSDDGEAKIELDVRIDGWRVHAQADPAEFAVPVPEGYELAEANEGLADYEADLIDVGAAAPAVTLIGMDDETFELAELKGKTLLLNFWFYH